MSTEDWILIVVLFGLAVALYVSSNQNQTVTNSGTNVSILPDSIWAIPAILGAWWLFFV
jgi:hypothetical protein